MRKWVTGKGREGEFPVMVCSIVYLDGAVSIVFPLLSFISSSPLSPPPSRSIPSLFPKMFYDIKMNNVRYSRNRSNPQRVIEMLGLA